MQVRDTSSVLSGKEVDLNNPLALVGPARVVHIGKECDTLASLRRLF